MRVSLRPWGAPCQGLWLQHGRGRCRVVLTVLSGSPPCVARTRAPALTEWGGQDPGQVPDEAGKAEEYSRREAGTEWMEKRSGGSQG